MLPVKVYAPVTLKETTQHSEHLGAYGVLVVYREEPTGEAPSGEDFVAMWRDKTTRDKILGYAYVEGGYGRHAYRFYPEEADGVEYMGCDLAQLRRFSYSHMIFEHDDTADVFDLSTATGIDFRCETPVLPPVDLGHEYNELLVRVLKGIAVELWGDAIEGSSTGEVAPLRAEDVRYGIDCEYLRRMVHSGAQLDGFEQLCWDLVCAHAHIPAKYSPYGDGDEVWFARYDHTVRGTIWGLDATDARYTSGKVVDVFCAESNMLYKEVETTDILGVFIGAGMKGFTVRELEMMNGDYPLIQDSIAPQNRVLVDGYKGVAGDDTWPEPRFEKGDIVIFREHANAPLERGMVVAHAPSRGDWAPRGVYYAIECSMHVTTIVHLPESNIYRRIGRFEHLGEREPHPGEEAWMYRPNICLNALIDAGSFDILPASQSGLLDGRDSWPTKDYGMRVVVEEADFKRLLHHIFEEHIDVADPVNATRAEGDGACAGGHEERFDGNGLNFYSLEVFEKVLCEAEFLEFGNEQELHQNCVRLLNAVADKARELNADPDGPSDFGVLVVGP